MTGLGMTLQTSLSTQQQPHSPCFAQHPWATSGATTELWHIGLQAQQQGK